MSRYLSLLLILGLTWGQTILAVFDFSNNGLRDNEVRTLTDRLRTELVKIDGITVVERTKIDDILKEQKLQRSGCVDECLIDVGKILGATDVVIGSVGRVGSTFTISARIVDATSGKIENAISFDSKYNIDNMLTQGMKDVAYRLLNKPLPNTINEEEIKNVSSPNISRLNSNNIVEINNVQKKNKTSYKSLNKNKLDKSQKLKTHRTTKSEFLVFISIFFIWIFWGLLPPS